MPVASAGLSLLLLYTSSTHYAHHPGGTMSTTLLAHLPAADRDGQNEVRQSTAFTWTERWTEQEHGLKADVSHTKRL